MTSDTSSPQVEQNQEKGRRHENEARRILNQSYRHASRATDTASPNGTTDVFNCADLIAVRAGWPTKFVQVKTNTRQFGTSWVSSFVDNEFTEFELWCRFDRQGWEILRYEPHEGEYGGELVEVLTIDTCDVKQAGKVYREYLESERGMDIETAREALA